MNDRVNKAAFCNAPCDWICPQDENFFATEDENDPWKIICFSKSDHAGDPEARLSVSGLVMYVSGVQHSWWTELQQHVALSSTDAECVALWNAVKNVMFVIQLLWSMKISLKLPVTVRVDLLTTLATF